MVYSVGGRWNRFVMTDQKHGRERQRPPPATGTRQDRLKRALRENLKRRKSQARARGDATMSPSNDGDVSPYDAGGKQPGK
jgi:hypothetical protein